MAKGLKFMPNVCNIAGNMKAKIIMKTNPFRSEFKNFCILGLSDHPKMIFEPSKGGKGKILNTTKTILKNIILSQNIANIPLIAVKGINRDNLRNNAEIIAKIKLATIPAEATNTISLLGYLRLL